jgi:hypothetical protein
MYTEEINPHHEIFSLSHGFVKEVLGEEMRLNALDQCGLT